MNQSNIEGPNCKKPRLHVMHCSDTEQCRAQLCNPTSVNSLQRQRQSTTLQQPSAARDERRCSGSPQPSVLCPLQFITHTQRPSPSAIHHTHTTCMSVFHYKYTFTACIEGEESKILGKRKKSKRKNAGKNRGVKLAETARTRRHDRRPSFHHVRSSPSCSPVTAPSPHQQPSTMTAAAL